MDQSELQLLEVHYTQHGGEEARDVLRLLHELRVVKRQLAQARDTLAQSRAEVAALEAERKIFVERLSTKIDTLLEIARPK